MPRAPAARRFASRPGERRDPAAVEAEPVDRRPRPRQGETAAGRNCRAAAAASPCRPRRSRSRAPAWRRRPRHACRSRRRARPDWERPDSTPWSRGSGRRASCAAPPRPSLSASTVRPWARSGSSSASNGRASANIRSAFMGASRAATPPLRPRPRSRTAGGRRHARRSASVPTGASPGRWQGSEMAQRSSMLATVGLRSTSRLTLR